MKWGISIFRTVRFLNIPLQLVIVKSMMHPHESRDLRQIDVRSQPSIAGLSPTVVGNVDPEAGTEQLAHGLVFIQYRTENVRVLPVFGKGALEVSPRVGHVHITVDDAAWHFVDASGETIIVVALSPARIGYLLNSLTPRTK